MHGEGTFEVELDRRPSSLDTGFTAFRGAGRKRFSGSLEARSIVEMIGGGTVDNPQCAYVALERIEGTLAGKRGAFVVVHAAWPRPEGLTIDIVPGTGEGELAGIAGTMTIRIVDGQHQYTVDWTLPE